MIGVLYDCDEARRGKILYYSSLVGVLSINILWETNQY
jgi:hypothetical protein